MKLLRKFIFLSAVLLYVALLSSCSSNGTKSQATGWKYNDPKWGGFEVDKYRGQETGPNLLFVQGGTFVMGRTQADIVFSNDNVPRRVTVNSFYIDQTEVPNVDYREYLYWTARVFGKDFPEVYSRALPDTLCWRNALAYNEPYVEYYFRHPSYNYYPVVGVSWVQANEYCKWRSDRVNEMMLINKGILKNDPTQQSGSNNFNTGAYLVGQYDGTVRKNLKDYNPSGTGTRHVRLEDGILEPDYRLPTEAEWEYAAWGLEGNNPGKGEELETERKIYPWNGNSLDLRDPRHGGWQGKFLANFKRGSGDYMGVAGGLNDNAEITAPVKSGFPNDYGLYNMAGNVNEWVADIYRPMTSYDENDMNPFRGNVFMQDSLDQNGQHVEKDSLGRVVQVPVNVSENVNRLNYHYSDYRDYLDGDTSSQVEYEFGVTSLINNHARVYKGGSWADMPYWLSPGARRYLDENLSNSTLGFRCAMDRVGSDAGGNAPGGNQIKKGKF